MKNKKTVIIISITIILLILGISILVFYRKSMQENQKKYEITYFDDLTPGSERNINVYDDKIEIITTHFCSAIDCVEQKPEKKVFDYSNENLNKLSKFLNNNFSTKDNKIEVHENDLNEYQKGVITGLLLSEYFFESNVEEYKYKIEYSKNENSSYMIYLKKDESILIKKLKINSDYDIVKIETYSLNFSKENLNILKEYIENEVKKENNNIIHKYSRLTKDEINIFNSIVKNNESYLANINNDAKLTYTISYNGINCPTPTLYLYSDNTYEYYYTFSSGNEKLIPKTDTYNYDITKIIKNIDKYEENNFGPYIIKDSNNNEYITYNSNNELIDFLKSIDVELEMCLKSQ